MQNDQQVEHTINRLTLNHMCQGVGANVLFKLICKMGPPK